MYYYISGKISYLLQGKAVIDNHGIGYELAVSDRTQGKIRASNSDEVRLFTYLHVREDAVELFGFFELEEKRLFEHLISVSGVGPKVAMSILSTLSPEKLILCIVSDDAKSIAQAPGIGLRTAQKIILEIKDKLKREGFAPDDNAQVSSPVSPTSSSAVAEALEALSSLGYTRSEALSALRVEGAEKMSVEELIRHGLKNLTRQ